MCEMDVFVSFESLDFRMSLDDLGDILYNDICVDRHFLNMIRVSKQAKEYLVSAVPLCPYSRDEIYFGCFGSRIPLRKKKEDALWH